jgi:hypothetical protein
MLGLALGVGSLSNEGVMSSNVLKVRQFGEKNKARSSRQPNGEDAYFPERFPTLGKLLKIQKTECSTAL